MSKSGISQFYLFPGTWLIDGSGFLSRAEGINSVTVIGRDGTPSVAPCLVEVADCTRAMYELFWDSGYGVFDSEHEFATHNGYFSALQIATSHDSGEPVILEVFEAFKSNATLGLGDLRLTPHAEFLSLPLLEAAWQEMSVAIINGCSSDVPRALFAQYLWLSCRRSNIKRVKCGVDNKTFPSVISLEDGEKCVGRLLASTECFPERVLRITIPLLQVKLVMDGLISRAIRTGKLG